MNNIRNWVIGVTAYLFVYALAVQIIPIPGISFLLFVFGNILFILLVYHVLKYGEEPKERFDEGYWYSDRPRIAQKDSEED
jgi:hypothetical protein